MYAVRRTIIVNMGGTAEVAVSAFVPVWGKGFFVYININAKHQLKMDIF